MQKDYARLEADYRKTINAHRKPPHASRPTMEDVRQQLRLKNEAKHALDWFNMTNPGITTEGGSRKKRRNTLRNRKN